MYDVALFSSEEGNNLLQANSTWPGCLQTAAPTERAGEQSAAACICAPIDIGCPHG